MFRAFYVGIADTRTLTANSPGDGRYECCAQLYPDIRETGFSCFRNCRGSDCFRPCRSHVVALFYRIHRLEDRPAEISSLPFPPHRNPLTQTDFGYLDLDNGAGIYFYQHLVFIFYRCRTPRRTAFSHYQCVKEYLLPFLYYRQCFRHYRQFIGK